MKTRSPHGLIRQTALSAIVLAFFAGWLVNSALALDDPALDREVERARLKQRRTELNDLENAVVGLREQVKRHMSDVVAIQQDAVARARKEYEASKVAAAESRFRLREYLEGTFLVERATLKGQIELLRMDLEGAIQRRGELRDLRLKPDSNERVVAELDVTQAEFDLEQAQMRLSVLEKYTKDKQTKILNAAVATAEAVEAEKKGLLDAEQAKEARFRGKAAELKVQSPEDFVIALIDDAVKREGEALAIIKECQQLETQIRDQPKDADALNAKLVSRKDQAVTLMNQAKAQLLEAANLGESVRADRTRLRDAETRLKKEREILELLEANLGVKP